MAISDIKIANAALLRIGEEPINAFSEEGRPALLANNTYELYRDGLLRAVPWRFAIRRDSLAANADGPEWEFSYAYTLPSDPYCLRVLTIENLSDLDWRLEGRTIVTDAGSPLHIKFIAKVTDSAQFDALFVETLVAKLQWKWAEALEKDAQLRADLAKEYLAMRLEAEGVNGSEGKNEPLPSGSWVEAHLS